MKNQFTALALMVVLICLAGQVSAQEITSRIATIPADAQLTGTGVLYSNTFFQERYMKLGKVIFNGIFIGTAFQKSLWRATGKYEGKVPDRLEANAFEALLGEFDMTSFVNERLRARMPEVRHFKIEFTEDAALSETLIRRTYTKTIIGDKVTQKMADTGHDVMFVVKVSYGFGARAGSEQVGFKKTYRPFVRLLGMLKRHSTNEVFWHGAVIAWGETGYKGTQKNNEKNIPREELVEAFKTVSEEAISLLILSLNGEQLEKMGDLVDETEEDAKF